MQRIPIAPRPEWQKRVEEWGLLFHTFEGGAYWNESAYYRLTAAQVDQLERATNELHEMCWAAVQSVIDRKRYRDLSIPFEAVPAIEGSWNDDSPSLYGRFDFGYDGVNPPKMLEYNADTPTALLEAAVIQWKWLEELFPTADQFNSIWEGLVEKWRALKEERGVLKGHIVHFAHEDSMEDFMTVTLLRDAAQEAGLLTEALHMHEIGWDAERRCFVDLKDERIRTLFKLYPWEWLIADQFGANVLQTIGDTQWIEPAWKMILSNKGILPILWELYPGHPYLLESYFDGPRDMDEYVKKPLLSREGANISVHSWSTEEATPGSYGEEGFIYQRFFRLPDCEGNHPVVGSWVIDGEARGIGIRESDGYITTDLARFVPHLFE